jgi:hypothetical protein
MERGYSDDPDILKILGGNTLRVMRLLAFDLRHFWVQHRCRASSAFSSCSGT